MKALSIQQPWAWLIIHGGKNVENRTWSTTFRGRFLIHAAKKFDHVAFQRLCAGGEKLPAKESFLRGGIVGSVELVDVVKSFRSKWFYGPYGFMLRDPRAVPFVPMNGRLGFFKTDCQDAHADHR